MQRKNGRLIDPSIEIRYNFSTGSSLDSVLHIGKATAIDKGCIFWLGTEADHQGKIELGTGVYIGPYTFLGSCHHLQIGDNTLIGAQSYIITVNHNTATAGRPISEQGYAGGNVNIGSNVWLGCHVVVLPGVTIGNRAVVGAGAVVTKSIPEGETWAGVPATRIK